MITKLGEVHSGMLSKGDRFSPDIGHYEVEIVMDMAAFMLDPDKPGMIRNTIARHIAGCALHTGVPANEGHWHITLESWVQKEFNLPERFTS